MEQLGFHWTDFGELSYLRLFRKSVEKIQVSLKCDKNDRYFYEDVFTFVTKFFLDWEIFLIKDVEKIKTHIICSVTFSRKLCGLRDNVEKYGGDMTQTIWRLHVAYWISKHAQACASTSTRACVHTHTHTNMYCFPRQQWFRERASVLPYTYIAFLVLAWGQSWKIRHKLKVLIKTAGCAVIVATVLSLVASEYTTVCTHFLSWHYSLYLMRSHSHDQLLCLQKDCYF